MLAITRATQRFDRERISFPLPPVLALFVSLVVALLHFVLVGSVSCRSRSVHRRRVRISRARRNASTRSSERADAGGGSGRSGGPWPAIRRPPRALSGPRTPRLS